LDDLDQGPNNSNNLLLVYTGTSVAKSQFPQGSANTEHLWAQAYGIDGHEPMYGDLFNLRPCDVDANSDRANKYYDNGGSPDANAPLCDTTSTTWEPRPIEKGDSRRIRIAQGSPVTDPARGQLVALPARQARFKVHCEECAEAPGTCRAARRLHFYLL
jgi:hypothetical protein